MANASHAALRGRVDAGSVRVWGLERSYRQQHHTALQKLHYLEQRSAILQKQIQCPSIVGFNA